MNSCTSTELSACAPPLMMFIMGTGRMLAPDAAQVAVERSALRGRAGARRGHGNGQNGIGAQAALIGRAIQVDHEAVDLGLLRGVFAVERGGNLAVNVGRGIQRALAEVTRLVAIPQFHGFMLAGGCARGHGGPSHAAVCEINIRFHGRIPAGIQNLSSDYFYNSRQSKALLEKLRGERSPWI